MKITSLTFLAFNINAALDTGKYDDISMDDIYAHIDSGDIFKFLENRLSKDVDFSIIDGQKKQELVSEWQSFNNAISASRKFGVEKKGLCLLVAYLLEGIQQRQDKNPPA